MPRPHKCRQIGFAPEVTVFKPQGVPARCLEVVELSLDELEAIRLADLEGLYQELAAARMGVSRATFARLIDAARRKVSLALLGGKMLVFQGGPVTMVSERTFACAECGKRFEAPFGTGRPEACPHCQSQRIHRVQEESGPGRGRCRRRCGNGGGGGGKGRGIGGRGMGVFVLDEPSAPVPEVKVTESEAPETPSQEKSS